VLIFFVSMMLVVAGNALRVCVRLVTDGHSRMRQRSIPALVLVKGNREEEDLPKKDSIPMTTSTTTTLKRTACFDCGPPRLRSRSVSWNRSGHHLASASSCGAVRLLVVDNAGGGNNSKEIGSLTGHGGSLHLVHFHVKEDAILASATDGTVRLWDVRDQRAPTHKLTSQKHSSSSDNAGEGAGIVSLEWNPVQTDLFLIAKRSGEIEIYDRRKLAANTTTGLAPAVYRHFAQDDGRGKFGGGTVRVPSAAIFEPTQGHTVYYGSTIGGEGIADIRLWPFMNNSSHGGDKSKEHHALAGMTTTTSYLAHSGPIHTMVFRPDGRRLVTGADDAIVGIWDHHFKGPTTHTSATSTMCCTRTLSNRTKGIRSVAISSSSSPSDESCLLAIATEEGMIDVVSLDDRATVGATNVPLIGQISLGEKTSMCPGADAMAFHPTAKYLLACTRLADRPVTILRFETTTT
jgi:WD40 repeat protein